MPGKSTKRKRPTAASEAERAIHALHELSLTALQTYRVLKPLLKQLNQK